MKNEPDDIRILLVDDRPENLLALESALERPDLIIHKATSGNQALGLMLEHEYAVVLMDVQMPDMDGYETAELMAGSERTRHIPIIFVTAINKEEQHIFKGYEKGAVDYLFKPVNPFFLNAKINVFLELHRRRTSLQNTSAELAGTIEEMKRSNKKLIEQQKSVIEEERLKVLLQMAGATAHELSQPLMGLLGSIDLMRIDISDPKKLARHMQRVEESSLRISDIVKKIQNIRHYDTRSYIQNSDIINFDQKVKILVVREKGEETSKAADILCANPNIVVHLSDSIAGTVKTAKNEPVDMICSGYHLSDGDVLGLLEQLEKEGVETPVAVITGMGDEMIASRVIQAGAYEYLPRDRISEKDLNRIVAGTLEKARLKRELNDAVKRMAEMTIRDELTGLYNRRYFMEALERETSRTVRYDTQLVLCMLDLDHFKTINDTFGHPAGDEVLSTIGAMIQEDVRFSDMVCRYGGEEFAVILPNTDLENAYAACERFRERVAEHPFSYKDERIRLTVSIGMASLENLTEGTAEELVNMADKALYAAKEKGRNRTEKHPGVPAATP